MHTAYKAGPCTAGLPRKGFHRHPSRTHPRGRASASRTHTAQARSCRHPPCTPAVEGGCTLQCTRWSQERGGGSQAPLQVRTPERAQGRVPCAHAPPARCRHVPAAHAPCFPSYSSETLPTWPALLGMTPLRPSNATPGMPTDLNPMLFSTRSAGIVSNSPAKKSAGERRRGKQ